MNPYDTLGVPPDASPDEIKAAYRKGAKKHHPDKPDGDGEKFGALVRSYEILSDPGKRERYDRTGQTEDPSLAQREAALRTAVARMVSEIIASDLDLETTDIRQRVLDHLETIRVGICESMTDLAGKIARAKKMRRRFRKEERKKARKAKVRPFEKDAVPPPPGLVEAAIDNAIAGIEQQIEKTQEALDLHDQVFAVFEAMGYDFVAPPPTVDVNAYYGAVRAGFGPGGPGAPPRPGSFRFDF